MIFLPWLFFVIYNFINYINYNIDIKDKKKIEITLLIKNLYLFGGIDNPFEFSSIMEKHIMAEH